MDPLRQDLYLYNEATGWVITSECRNGVEEWDDARWTEEFDRGTFLPISLVQDDSLILRLVVNDQLTEQEAEEWLDRFEWKLSVPDGRLALCAGIEYLECPEDGEGYVQFVDVLAGDYLVEVYTYFGSPNEPDTDHFDGETLKQYWRRTRKRERLPEWIRAVDEDYEWDPDVPTHLIGTLVRLSPLTREPERPPLEVGWIPERVQPRKPELCPRGLLSTEVAGLTDREPYVQTDLHYFHDVPGLVTDLQPVPIAGGEVVLPVKDLVLPYWLAWFCGETHPYVRLFDCSGVDIAWPGFEVGIKGTPTEEGWRVDIEGMNARFTQFGQLRQIGALLEALPDGAGVELAAAENPDEEGVGERFGFHRYVGRVRGGLWHVEATYPPVDRETLMSMLALAADTESGQGIAFRDRGELERVQEDCEERDMLLSDNPPQQRGSRLTFKKKDSHFMPFLGARFWVVRFGDTWPTMDRDDEEEVDDWEAAMDKIAEVGAAWTQDEPIVYEGEFASYSRTDLATAEVMDAGELVEIDAAMRALGFQCLGDLHSTQTFRGVFRGYGQGLPHVYGAIICNGFGSQNVDFVTRFGDGWSLTTSIDPLSQGMEKNRKTQSYRKTVDVDVAELLQVHEEEVARLAAEHGEPQTVPGTLEAFAAALDRAMKKHFANG
jgi:hypothetical protein